MDPDHRDEAGVELGLHGMEGVRPSIHLSSCIIMLVVLIDDLIYDCETNLCFGN